MYRISILLVTIICAIIALSIGLPANSAIFPFFSKSYVFSNIIVVSMLFLMFFESFFLYRRLNSLKQNSNAEPSHRLMKSLKHNVIESIYFICLLLPFIALCKVFLAFEFSEILSPFFVFAFLIIVFRLIIMFLTKINASFESFMRVILILTFLLPVLGFLLWEFSGISAVWLAYFSPAWFQLEVLRSPSMPIYPFFIIWLMPVVVMLTVIFFREKSRIRQEKKQQ